MIQAVEKPNWKCQDYLSIKTDEHSLCPVHVHTQEKSRLTSADKPRQRGRGKDRCRRADGERPPASRRLRYRWKCRTVSVSRAVWPRGKRSLVADLKATRPRTWSQLLLPINSVASAGHSLTGLSWPMCMRKRYLGLFESDELKVPFRAKIYVFFIINIY